MRTLILASSAVILFAVMFNVGELLLADQELGAGAAAAWALRGVWDESAAPPAVGGAVAEP